MQRFLCDNHGQPAPSKDHQEVRSRIQYADYPNYQKIKTSGIGHGDFVKYVSAGPEEWMKPQAQPRTDHFSPRREVNLGKSGLSPPYGLVGDPAPPQVQKPNYSNDLSHVPLGRKHDEQQQFDFQHDRKHTVEHMSAKPHPYGGKKNGSHVPLGTIDSRGAHAAYNPQFEQTMDVKAQYTGRNMNKQSHIPLGTIDHNGAHAAYNPQFEPEMDVKAQYAGRNMNKQSHLEPHGAFPVASAATSSNIERIRVPKYTPSSGQGKPFATGFVEQRKMHSPIKTRQRVQNMDVRRLGTPPTEFF